MTCIVGYVDDKGVHVGVDSLGSNGSSKVVRKDTKVFIKEDMIFGYTSSFRMGQLLRFKLNIPKCDEDKDVYEYMCTDFIDAVIKCFDDGDYTEMDKNVKEGGVFLVGFKGRLFKVQSDFQVGETTSLIDTCGSGGLVAKGAISALLQYAPSIDTKKLLTIALESAETYIPSVQGPFKILTLKHV